MSAATAVQFRQVDVIFGRDQQAALALLDQGQERDSILAETGCVVGVADASITIEQGEICVLMGLSGSGKSTLLRCVNRLNQASRGEVLINDGEQTVDVSRCPQRTLRHLRTERIAMVFQQFALLPWRTVAENVGLGLELRGTNKTERETIVKDKLKLVGLDQWADKYAHELSGGMQQRVGLARAFATDADILLMDEPFSALDPLIREHLQDELLALQKSLQKTIIFVSHDLDEALKLGSHIAIMENGRIVQYGKPEEIVLNPANRYVAEFVAHMNPLNVLRGESLMTPLTELSQHDDQILLDWSGQHKLTLTPAPAVSIANQAGQLVDYSNELSLSSVADDALLAAPIDILMRDALEIRHATGKPLLLKQDGQLVGVIGDDEIYRGILRQTHLADE